MPKEQEHKHVKLLKEKWDEIVKNKERLNDKGGATYSIADTIYEANRLLTRKLDEEDHYGSQS